MKFFLALFALLAVTCAEVVDLTHDNFDSFVTGEKAYLIEFYAPWCGHCVRLEPEYTAVGDKFPSSGEVLVAKVNADQHRELGTRFGIRGFPTIKWFPKGDIANVEDYKGARTAAAITEFIALKTGKAVPTASSDKSGASAAAAAAAASTDGTKGQVVVLTPENFDKIVDGSKDLFVEFYAPWCGHCKSLEPTWNQLAAAYSGFEDKVVIAKVDGSEHRDLAGRFGIRGFPTLKLFKKGKATTEATDYSGGRSLDNLANWLSNETGVSPGAKKAAEASGAAAGGAAGTAAAGEHVKVLTAANFEASIAGKKALVEFYAPWCGHCVRLLPEFEKMAAGVAHAPEIVAGKVNCDEHKDLCARFDVRGYPTIHYFDNGVKTDSYQGARTSPELAKYVLTKAGRVVEDAAPAAAAAAAATPDVAQVKPNLVSLTPANFDSTVTGEKAVLVAFTAPWCGHCKRLHPELSLAADLLSKESRVIVAEVDADAHKDLGQRFEVRGYPTIFWFPKGKSSKDKPEAYSGGRSSDALLKWVLEKLDKSA